MSLLPSGAGRDTVEGATIGGTIAPGVGHAVGGGMGLLGNLFQDVPLLGDLLDPFGLFGDSNEQKAYEAALKKLREEAMKTADMIGEKTPEIQQASWEGLQNAMSLWTPYYQAINARYGPEYVPDMKAALQNPFQDIDLKR